MWEEPMAEVEWNRDGISYLFTSNRVNLLKSSGFFPSLKSLPQPYCRLETRERAFPGTGGRFTILVSSKKPERGLARQGPLLPQQENTVAGLQ
jgi:hypothetical protein